MVLVFRFMTADSYMPLRAECDPCMEGVVVCKVLCGTKERRLLGKLELLVRAEKLYTLFCRDALGEGSMEGGKSSWVVDVDDKVDEGRRERSSPSVSSMVVRLLEYAQKMWLVVSLLRTCK